MKATTKSYPRNLTAAQWQFIAQGLNLAAELSCSTYKQCSYDFLCPGCPAIAFQASKNDRVPTATFAYGNSMALENGFTVISDSGCN